MASVAELNAMIQTLHATVEQLQQQCIHHQNEIAAGQGAMNTLQAQFKAMETKYGLLAASTPTGTDHVYRKLNERVDNTNLLKAKEPQPFLNKMPLG